MLYGSIGEVFFFFRCSSVVTFPHFSFSDFFFLFQSFCNFSFPFSLLLFRFLSRFVSTLYF